MFFFSLERKDISRELDCWLVWRATGRKVKWGYYLNGALCYATI